MPEVSKKQCLMTCPTVFNNYAVSSNTKNYTCQADSFAINNRLYSPILIVACLLITSGVKGLSSSTFYTKHTNLNQDIWLYTGQCSFITGLVSSKRLSMSTFSGYECSHAGLLKMILLISRIRTRELPIGFQSKKN